MRVAFMGSPDFAVPALDALVEAGHEVARVYAQPPRPAGRGHRETPCPVHARAEALGLPVRTPRTFKDAEAQQAFAGLDLDAAVVAAYGLLLPEPVLTAPRLGCLNIHASLLPRWRGAAPIQAAILHGDSETGISIMQMDAGLDTGPVVLTERLPIAPDTTAGALHDALAPVGARLVVEALEGLAAGRLAPAPQPSEGVTHAPRIGRDAGRLDWTEPADALERRVRAMNPWPGAYCLHGDERLRLHAAEVVPGSHDAAPGTVLDHRLTVACGRDALRPTRVQRSGKAPMDTDALLRGHAVPAGTVLG